MAQRDIDAMAEAATDEYLRRSSMAFLECAINVMVTHMEMEEVADILRRQADFLEEWG